MEKINYYCECFEEFLENNENIIADQIAKENNTIPDQVFYNDVIDRAKEMYDEYVNSQITF
jgi:hypothetical protein